MAIIFRKRHFERGDGGGPAVVAIVVIFVIVAAVAFFMFGGQFMNGGSKTNKVDVNLKAPVPTKSP
jgi:hypothetical protein